MAQQLVPPTADEGDGDFMKFVNNGLRFIWSPEGVKAVKERIAAGGDVVAAIGEIAAALVSRILSSAQENGLEFEDQQIMVAGRILVAAIGEIVGKITGEELSEDELDEAMSIGLAHFAEATGRVDPQDRILSEGMAMKQQRMAGAA